VRIVVAALFAVIVALALVAPLRASDTESQWDRASSNRP
jgi:hypothetical protein